MTKQMLLNSTESVNRPKKPRNTVINKAITSAAGDEGKGNEKSHF